MGVASYGNPQALEQTLSSIRRMSTTDFRCLIVSNVHPDAGQHARAVEIIMQHVAADSRFVPKLRDDNIGYSGAVNEILAWAETEYIAYMDNDAIPMSHGWDELMAATLDKFHEIGILFPNGGGAPIDRGEYLEILWGVGFCWMTTRLAAQDVLHEGPLLTLQDGRLQYFDEVIGHQDEVDFQTRVRLAGYKIAALPSVNVIHRASASSNPASLERINRGVVNWVDKWCHYFCGKDIGYHSTNVWRHEDWPPSALHMERYFKQHLGENFNATPNTVVINGVEYDLIRVPRLKGFYRNRII